MRCRVLDGSLINQSKRWNCSNIDDASLVASWRESGRGVLQGRVGWLSRSQIAASWIEGYEGIVHALLRNRSHCTYLSFSAIMRSQRLLRVRDGIFSHIAAFTNMNRLPRRKAYVLSAHAV